MKNFRVKYLLALYVGFFSLDGRDVCGQSIYSYVITASGGTSVTSPLKLNSNFGELLVSTLGSSQIIFTQGFLQPEAYNTFIPEFYSYDVNVFPNPFSDSFFIKFKQNHSGFVFKLFNIQGLIIADGIINAGVETYHPELKPALPGCYFLNLTSIDGGINLLFKIIRL